MKFLAALTYILPLLIISSESVLAHPGEHHGPISPAVRHAKRHAAQKRALQARSCSAAVSSYHTARKAKRSLQAAAQPSGCPTNIAVASGTASSLGFAPSSVNNTGSKRQNDTGFNSHNGTNFANFNGSAPNNQTGPGFFNATGNGTFPSGDCGSLNQTNLDTTGSTSSPHITQIQNFTCVTAPEVTEGPYYINDELVRQDLTETQGGIKLVLDIGVIDINTCEPLPNVLVEIWSANATGVYSSYSATLGGSPGAAPNGTMSLSDIPSGTASVSFTDSVLPSGSAVPSGAPGGAGGMASSALVRNETFSRGGWATNDEGIVELTTIYPGFYEGRAPHIHTMVHLNWSQADNGTIISGAGTLLHIGQFFMDESWNDQVFALSPYTDNTNNRTLNADDTILAQENTDGNNAYIELSLLGTDLSDGILGYVTMGVNSSASYTIMNTNYLNSTTSD
ncbi:Intradiol ring-cleavage dioxygenase [Abortiporus biennis]|nr:Intradiol ring-cleavage dioxygenase [Abortiporus biennis]